MRMNAILVTQVRSLKDGDVFAYSRGVDVLGGKISAIIDFPFQLTDDQRAYMIETGLTIPKNQDDPIDKGTRLILGNFKRPYKHVYLEYGEPVAVFATSDKE